MGMQRSDGNVIFNTRKGPRTNFDYHDLNSVILPDPKAFDAHDERTYSVSDQSETFEVGKYIKKIEELSKISFSYSSDCKVLKKTNKK